LLPQVFEAFLRIQCKSRKERRDMVDEWRERGDALCYDTGVQVREV
jgi:hypothetical protein